MISAQYLTYEHELYLIPGLSLFKTLDTNLRMVSTMSQRLGSMEPLILWQMKIQNLRMLLAFKMVSTTVLNQARALILANKSVLSLAMEILVLTLAYLTATSLAMKILALIPAYSFLSLVMFNLALTLV